MLADKFKQSGVPAPKKRITIPVWKGPEEDGITFSLLSRFLVCRERFRLLVVEGLKPVDGFNHKLEFGSMWHVCEQSHAEEEGRWLVKLMEYGKKLCKQYPFDQEKIDNWFNITKLMFPIYVKHWSRHPDMQARKPVLSERAFTVPYQLPSGRTVKLRGKWDSVDEVDGKLWLQENKTKGRVEGDRIVKQLSFDLQTGIYLTALTQELEAVKKRLGKGQTPHELSLSSIAGVRYNVVKRPAQYQGKRETAEGFYQRLQSIVADDPTEFFMRWNVEVMTADLTRFRTQCLDPILEQLCDWWAWVQIEPDNPFRLDEGVFETGTAMHWRHPFGVWNVLDEGGVSELDHYLATGSEAGLQRSDELFPELKEE